MSRRGNLHAAFRFRISPWRVFLLGALILPWATRGAYASPLSLEYKLKYNHVMEQADATNIPFYFGLFSNTTAKSGVNFSTLKVRVWNGAGIEVSTNFTNTTPVDDGGGYLILIKALATAVAGSGHILGLEMTTGGDTFPLTKSDTNEGGGLDGIPWGGTNGAVTHLSNGQFQVTAGNLSIGNVLLGLNVNNSVVYRGGGSPTTFRYRVLYKDTVTVETNDGTYQLGIYDSATNNVSSQFNLGSQAWDGSAYAVDATSLPATPVTNNYYLGVAKLPGTYGATLPLTLRPFAIDVLAANLSLTWVSRSAATVGRGDATGTQFRFQTAYGDGTLYSNGTGYTLAVWDTASNDVTSQFNLGAMTWDGAAGNFRVTVTARSTAALSAGYMLAVGKTNGSGDPDVVNPVVASTNFPFSVVAGALTVVFSNRSQASMGRADTNAVRFSYRAVYGDGVTEETTAGNQYSLRVLDSSSNDVSGAFTNSSPIYSNGAWQVTVRAKPSASTNGWYFLGVRKSGGSETSAEAQSIVDLGLAGGRFFVTNGTLSVTFLSRSIPTIPVADSTGVTFPFQVAYPDGTLELTGPYQVNLYRNTNTLANGFFTNLVSLDAFGTNWNLKVLANPSVVLAGNYLVSVSRTNGDTLAEEKSTVDLAAGGTFTVTNSGLTVDFIGYRNLALPNDGTTSNEAQFQLRFPDSVTTLTNDLASIDYGVYDGTNGLTTNFTLLFPVTWSNARLNARFVPLNGTLTTNNYRVAVWKTNGGTTGMTAPKTWSTNNLGSNGLFSIVPQLLTLVYQSRSNGTLERGDSNKMAFIYRVSDPLSNIITNGSNFTVRFYSDASNDITTAFSNDIPVYVPATSNWIVRFKALKSAPVGSGFFVGIQRGGTSNALLEKMSPADLGGSGVYSVTAGVLSLVSSNLGTNLTVRADTNRLVYKYRVLYKDLATEETNDGGYNVLVRDRLGVDRTSMFTLTPPVYSNAGYWWVGLTVRTNATFDSNYMFEVSKGAGATGDTLGASLSSNTLGLAGLFKVTNAQLSVTYYSHSTNRYYRLNPAGVRYEFQVNFTDTNTLETSSASEYLVKVYDASGVDRGSSFTNSLSWTNTRWTLTLWGTSNTPPSSNYILALSRTNGDILPEEKVTNDLAGSNQMGRFDLTDLAITYTSRTTPSSTRGDGRGIYYWYRVETNQDPSLPATGGDLYGTRVYQGGIDVTTNFILSNNTYVAASNAWQVQLVSDSRTPTGTGYFVGIRKGFGVNPSGLIEESSTNDLGASGLFDITNTVLSVKFLSLYSNLVRHDTVPRPLQYRLMFSDTNYLKTNGTGYVFKVWTSNNADVTSDFTIGTPVWSNATSSWWVTYVAKQAAAIASNYYVTLQKTAGIDGDLLPQTDSRATLSNGSWNGGFNLGQSVITLRYTNRLLPLTRRGVADEYRFSLVYNDGSTLKTNGDGFTVNVYDGGGVNRNAWFNILGPVYGGGSWQVLLTPLTNSNVAGAQAVYAGYHLGIQKTNGTDGDVVVGEPRSTNTVNLTAVSGAFEVANAYVRFLSNSGPFIRRADGRGVTNFFRVVYFYDGLEYATNGSNFAVNVYNNGAQVTALFSNSLPTYQNGVWSVVTHAKDTTPAGVSYHLGVSNAGTGTAFRVWEELSTNMKFSVSNAFLRLQTVSANTNLFRRGDGVGQKLQFKVFYGDNVTEETNDTGYSISITNQGGAVVTPLFETIGSPAYSNSTGTWWAWIKSSNTTPYTNAYHVRVQKGAGGEGDTLGASWATNFTLTNAILSVNFLSLSNTNLEQADNRTADYRFRALYGDTNYQEALDGGNYQVAVLDLTNADVTGQFDVSNLAYNNGSWLLSVAARVDSPVLTNYRVQVSKSSGDTLAPEISTNDLGSGGRFHVTNANLTAVFGTPTNSFAMRGDTNGVRFRFNILYRNGTALTNDGASITNKVLDPADVTTNFIVGPLVYSNGAWDYLVLPRVEAAVKGTYTLQVQKGPGTSLDVLATTNATNALGAGGYFAVSNAILSALFTNRSVASFEKADGVGTQFDFLIRYPDLTNTLTNGAVLVDVYTNTTSIGTNFLTNSLAAVYTNGRWVVRVKSDPDTLVRGNLRLAVRITNGDTLPQSFSDADLGSGGLFAVTGATLTLKFLARSPDTVRQADGIGTLYTYRITFDDTNYLATNDLASFSARVYNSAAAEVTSQFTVTNLGITNGVWYTRIKAFTNTAVATGYGFAVSKSAGSSGDTLVLTNSKDDLGAVNGAFQVTNESALNLVFLPRPCQSFRRGSTAKSAGYPFQVLYGDGQSQETTDASSYVVKVYDALTNDRSSDFSNAPPAYQFSDGAQTNGWWTVQVYAKTTASIANGYYFIGLEKLAGSSGDVASNKHALVDLGHGFSTNVGILKNTNGIFFLSDMGISSMTRSGSSIEQGDDQTITYSFQLENESGTPLTPGDLPGSGFFHARVYDNLTNDQGATFTNLGFTYSNARWQVVLSNTRNTPVTNGYFITVEKGYGDGHALSPGDSHDPELLGALNGVFDVVPATLNIAWKWISRGGFELLDGTGVTLAYALTYDNQEPFTTLDAIAHRPLDGSGNDVSSQFDASGFTWNGASNHFEVALQGLSNLVTGTGFRMAVQKNPGGTLATLTNCVSPYPFDVSKATLNMRFLSRSNALVERGGGQAAEYLFKIYFDKVVAGDFFNQQSGDVGYQIIVSNTNTTADHSGQFDAVLTNLSPTVGWSLKLYPRPECPVADGYYAIVLKTNEGQSHAVLGISPDVPVPSTSTNLDVTGRSNGLGPVNGIFAVTQATLQIVHQSRTEREIVSGSGSGTRYQFLSRFGNTNFFETNDAGSYVLDVYDGNGSNVTPRFTMSALSNGGPAWHVTLLANEKTPQVSNLTLGVSKTAGTTGAVASLRKATDGDILPTTNGVFHVVGPDYRITFVTNSTNFLRRAGSIGTVIGWVLRYPSGAEEAAESNFTVTVWEPGAGDRTTNFIVSPVAYSNGCYRTEIRARAWAPAVSNYWVGVSLYGTYGSLPLTPSKNGTNLDGVTGVFHVPETSVDLVFTGRSNSPATKGSEVSYTYRVFYPNSNEITNDTGFLFQVLDRNGVDRSVWFSNVSHGWEGTNWRARFQVLYPAFATNGYHLQVSKGPGITGEVIYPKSSTNDLGFAAGTFAVLPASLNLVITNRGRPQVARFDGVGTHFEFLSLYGDGSQESSDSNAYLAVILDDAGSNRTSQFVSGPPVFMSNRWYQKWVAGGEVPLGSYRMTVRKADGESGESGAIRYSTNDLGDALGRFDVIQTPLTLVYDLVSLHRIPYNLPSTVKFRVLYPDGVSQVTQGLSLSNLSVRDAAGLDDTARYLLSPLRYEGTNWAFELTPPTGTPLTESNFFSLTSSNAEAYLPPRASTNDLGVAGTFSVIAGTLDIVFTQVEKPVLKAGDLETIRFQVRWRETGTALTNGLTRDRFTLLSMSNTSIDSDYESYSLAYVVSNWEISFRPRSGIAASRGNLIRAGGTHGGAAIPTKISPMDLGTNAGTFAVVVEEQVRQNYPNPFDPRLGPTRIQVDLMDPGEKVELYIYTLTGDRVRTLKEGSGITDKYVLTWDGRNDKGEWVASGLYYAVVKVGTREKVIKVLLRSRS